MTCCQSRTKNSFMKQLSQGSSRDCGIPKIQGVSPMFLCKRLSPHVWFGETPWFDGPASARFLQHVNRGFLKMGVPPNHPISTIDSNKQTIFWVLLWIEKPIGVISKFLFPSHSAHLAAELFGVHHLPVVHAHVLVTMDTMKIRSATPSYQVLP